MLANSKRGKPRFIKRSEAYCQPSKFPNSGRQRKAFDIASASLPFVRSLKSMKIRASGYVTKSLAKACSGSIIDSAPQLRILASWIHEALSITRTRSCAPFARSTSATSVALVASRFVL